MCRTRNLEVLGSNLTAPTWFVVGVSFDKILQSHGVELAKPRKEKDNVSYRPWYHWKKCWKRHKTHSFNEHFTKQSLVFNCLQYTSFENTMGKGEIARNEQFLFFPQCFLHFLKIFCHFHQIWNCRLRTLSVWKRLKFVVRERANVPGFDIGG